MTNNRQVIFRMTENINEIEVAEQDINNNLMFKRIDPDKFINKINEIYTSFYRNYIDKEKKLCLLEEGVIASNRNYTVIKQEGKKRMVTFSLCSDFEFYNINFPNAIYIVKHENMKRILEIECYAYKEYKGIETELYEYPLPNELTANFMCIGNQSREIENEQIVKSLNKILYTPYSHVNFSGLYGFSDTKTYFEYLQYHEFPYDKLKKLNYTLAHVM